MPLHIMHIFPCTFIGIFHKDVLNIHWDLSCFCELQELVKSVKQAQENDVSFSQSVLCVHF